jgi:hypothetical protein
MIMSEKSVSNLCLDISLQSVPSKIKASDGKDVPFTRAILTLRNVCDAEVISVVPQATLGQESGTVQDVTSALAPSAPSSLPPGGTASWDVYDLLLPAHQGTSSKIHMFGHRAALNWRFDLAAWAEYRLSSASEPLKTPVRRWSFRWTVTDPSTRDVALTIEEIKA